MEFIFLAAFGAFRIIICFYLLFGILGPLVLPRTKAKSGIEKLLFSFVGLGGLIVVDVFLLTMLNIYDFISLLFSLLAIPIIIYLLKNIRKGEDVEDLIFRLEKQIIKNHVIFIENILLRFQDFNDKLKERFSFKVSKNLPHLIAVVIAIMAAIIRIIPALTNPAPFTRLWYYELQKVKNLTLQNYFGDLPEPAGMEVLVNVFSTLTQVTPELMLHIMGALVSFFLAIIIFWLSEVITKGKNYTASLLATSVYAFTPMLLTPLVLDLEVEASSLEMAFCFAIPTTVFYLRQIRTDTYKNWFYVIIGIFATALTDLFVFIIILVPFLVIGLFTIPGKFLVRRFARASLILIGTIIFALAPYIIYLLSNNLDFFSFFREQLLNTMVFSYFPNLIAELDILSIYYFASAIVLLIIQLARRYIGKSKIGREVIFLIYFSIIAFIFTPYFSYSYILVDPDQLGPMYAIMICVFIGIIFKISMEILGYILRSSNEAFAILKNVLGVVVIGIFLIMQNGIIISRSLPQTLPNGFFEAYYNITDEHLAYTYATVSPEIDRNMSLNRHYFMNYGYFLDNYGTIDSLYQEYLEVPINQRRVESVPPASIFLFMEKPPYSTIQQGILYDSYSVMNDMEQWVESYAALDGRNIRVYYETNDAIIYELINRRNESLITDLLFNIYQKRDEPGENSD